MTRITEIQNDDESEVIPRLLMQIHKAIDETFPGVTPPTDKFSQTVFNQPEDTMVDRPAAVPEENSAEDSASESQRPQHENQGEFAHSAIHEMVNSGHEPTQHSQLEQYELRKKASLPVKVLRLTILILIFAAISAYWAYKNLV